MVGLAGTGVMKRVDGRMGGLSTGHIWVSLLAGPGPASEQTCGLLVL